MKEQFGIGRAVEELRKGNIVQRRGWNGKNMYLVFVPGDQWLLGDGVRAVRFAQHPLKVFSPWVAMKTADGSLVPWLCSQTDLLADDWQLAD